MSRERRRDARESRQAHTFAPVILPAASSWTLIRRTSPWSASGAPYSKTRSVGGEPTTWALRIPRSDLYSAAVVSSLRKPALQRSADEQQKRKVPRRDAPLAALLGADVLHALGVPLVLLPPELLGRLRVPLDAHLARLDAGLERPHRVLALLGLLPDLDELELLPLADGGGFVNREALEAMKRVNVRSVVVSEPRGRTSVAVRLFLSMAISVSIASHSRKSLAACSASSFLRVSSASRVSVSTNGRICEERERRGQAPERATYPARALEPRRE